MKYWLLLAIFVGALAISPLPAQISNGGGLSVSGSVTNGHCVSFISSTSVQDSGGACGGSGSPCITTALSLQYNNSGAFGCLPDFTFSGHTITMGASGIFDFSAGSVTAGLKLPTAAGAAPTADGFAAFNSTSHLPVWGSNTATVTIPVNTTATGSNWLTAYNSATGAFTKAQPAFSDISGTLALASAVFANQGTTTTVLHGNAAGNPSFGSVVVGDFAAQTANTILGNYTGSSAAPTFGAAPAGGTSGCSGSADTVIYTAGTGWGCHQISGSGTVNSGTIHQMAQYASSTNAVSSDATLTDDGTTLTYSGTTAALPAVTATSVTTTSASLSGYLALAGNTSNNSVTANTAGWMGPSSATFTGYACQFPATAPSGNQFLQCGTPISGVSTGTWVTLSGSGTVTVVASGALTSTALVTGGGTTTLQTPSATSTLDSSGNLAVAAGGSLGSADTGTPKFTFATNKVTLNQPLNHALTTNQEVYGTSTNLTTVSFPASSGAVTLTMPNTTDTMVGRATTDTLTNKSIAGSEINSGTVPGAQMPVVNTVVDTSSPVTVSSTLASEYHFNENATAATAMTYNLPTAAAGKQFCISNANNGSAANTGVLTFATSATGQFITFTDGTQSATGGNVTSGGAASDAACVVGIDSTHWQLYVQRGTWAKH